LIFIEIFRSARTNALFGQNYFSHKQIAFAKVKKQYNEPFTDEDLPVSHPKKWLSIICIVLSCFVGLCSLFTVIGSFSSTHMLNEADKAFEAKNYTEAVKWYKKASEQGEIQAMHNLGLCYYNGYGVSANTDEAIELFKQSARMGHKSSIEHLNTLGIPW
jgi:TPR repeat protein